MQFDDFVFIFKLYFGFDLTKNQLILILMVFQSLIIMQAEKAILIFILMIVHLTFKES